MAVMEKFKPESRRSGCGVMEIIYDGVFRRIRLWRRTSSSSSKRRRRGGAVVDAPALPVPSASEKGLKTRPPVASNPPRRSEKAATKQPGGVVWSSFSGSAVSREPPPKKKVPAVSQALALLLPDHRGSGSLVRASSSYMIVSGNSGNLRQSLPMGKTENPMKGGGGDGNGFHGNSVMGNIVKKPPEKEKNGTIRRAFSEGMKPEELKVLGNGEFKKGRFAEALAYYDLAISLDAGNASYRSNRSAALTGLGRLLEAVEECREAVRLDPSYCRAHHRLATLYLRLGEAGMALDEYKLSGREAKPSEIAAAQDTWARLARCSEAGKVGDWRTVLKEAGCAASGGADSAPQVYAWQAEALLKLHRHDDAGEMLSSDPNFDAGAATKFFGVAATVHCTLVRAQVDMAIGRFDAAVAAAQRAVRLDPSSKEAETVFRKVRAAAAARSRGNELFISGRFSEACAAYGEGLEQEPWNAVLLCNRAACRSKLRQWERAVEDCNSALRLRHSYSKARLRRADCNAKLERWVAAIEDYEALIRQTPGDEEVGRAMFEARVQLKKRLGEDVAGMKFSSDVVVVAGSDHFRHTVNSPGMAVVLFCKKTCNIKNQMRWAGKLCRKYPSVRFLKMDVEENPYIAKSSGASSVPSFQIYKNGSKVTDIDGNNPDLLEASIQFFAT